MKYAKPEWQNGQPFSPEYDDVYFSKDHGLAETEHVFIQHNQLPQRFSSHQSIHFVIAETGFGSGLNFLLCVKHWLALSQPHQVLHFYSVEGLPFAPSDLRRAHSAWPELADIADVLQQQYQVASYGFHRFDLFEGRVRLCLMLGDIEAMLPHMQCTVDAWLLDGFAPGKNPGMWSEKVFSRMAQLSHSATTFSTYTVAGAVRRGLQAAGFDVQKVAGYGSKRQMLCGRYASGPSASVEPPWFALSDRGRQNQAAEKRVCVIGAGVAGLSTAWSLVKRGYQVDLFEAGDRTGYQASGNPLGMLMPRLSLQDSADGEFYAAAYFYALRCLQQLDPEQACWQQTGGLQLPSSQRVIRQIEGYPQDPEGVQAFVRRVSAEQASQLADLAIVHTCHYFPLAACIEPVALLQRLVDEMGDALNLHFNTPIDSLSFDQGWKLLDDSGRLIQQTQCLVLANAWQIRRFEQTRFLHLNPARGQLSELNPLPETRGLRMPLSYEGYFMPLRNGQHIVGASFEMDDCDTRLREAEHEANLSQLNHWLGTGFTPELLAGGRASVRAVTPDRCPVLGPVVDEAAFCQAYAELHKGRPYQQYPPASLLPGLYINSGHGARGFTSAFLCAELLAAMIEDEPLPVANRVRYALHPARFLIRTLKKKRT